MEGFKITDPNFDLIFLGDYTDRGKYGVDVIYSISLLKITNPNNVFMVRGNHEDLDLNARYGFSAELEHFIAKKELLDNVLSAIDRFYNTLPVALFIGTDKEEKHIIACHGGMEPGFNHAPLLLHQQDKVYRQLLPYKLDRRQFVNRYRENLSSPAWFDRNFITQTEALGFMWSDFTLSETEHSIFNQYRGLRASKADTKTYMGSSVGAFFRGHQHDGETLPLLKKNNGVLSHWHKKEKSNFNLQDGMVLTFSVAADSQVCKNYKINFDTYGILTTSGSFTDWSVQVVKQDINP